MKLHVIANKNWEVEPLLNAFLTRKIYKNIDLPDKIIFPLKNSEPILKHRAEFNTRNNITVQISCVQDFILDPSKEKSSQYKYEVALPILFENEDSDLIICFGTAGYPEDIEINGSAMMGHNFFIHSGRDDNPESKLKLEEEGKVFGEASVITKNIYTVLAPDKNKLPITSYLQQIPENPKKKPTAVATSTNVAISVINITDYDDYIWADKDGLDRYKSVDTKRRAASIETTHGLIAVYAKKLKMPSMWVSAITDREGFFDIEVNPMQNYMCAYNAGIVMAKVIDSL